MSRLHGRLFPASKECRVHAVTANRPRPPLGQAPRPFPPQGAPFFPSERDGPFLSVCFLASSNPFRAGQFGDETSLEEGDGRTSSSGISDAKRGRNLFEFAGFFVPPSPFFLVRGTSRTFPKTPPIVRSVRSR